MDALLEKKLKTFLDGDQHRFKTPITVNAEKTVRRPCYYCLSEGTHTLDCPSRGDIDSSSVRQKGEP